MRRNLIKLSTDVGWRVSSSYVGVEFACLLERVSLNKKLSHDKMSRIVSASDFAID